MRLMKFLLPLALTLGFASSASALEVGWPLLVQKTENTFGFSTGVALTPKQYGDRVTFLVMGQFTDWKGDPTVMSVTACQRRLFVASPVPKGSEWGISVGIMITAGGRKRPLSDSYSTKTEGILLAHGQ